MEGLRLTLGLGCRHLRAALGAPPQRPDQIDARSFTVAVARRLRSCRQGSSVHGATLPEPMHLPQAETSADQRHGDEAPEQQQS